MKARWFEKIRDFLAACLRPRRETARMRVGIEGETAAADYLRRQGWKIITRNWRHGRDELDIVARDGVNLVFVEVKSRTVPLTRGRAQWRANGYFAVDKRKRHALARACRAYMRALSAPPPHFRFDIIEVAFRPGAVSPEITHHRAIPLFPPHFGK
jgi:putative endonuclease